MQSFHVSRTVKLKRSFFRNDIPGQRHIPGQGEFVRSRFDEVRVGRSTVQAADVPGKRGIHSRAFMEEVVLKFDASLILRRIGDDQVARARLARASSRCSQVFDHHGTVRLDIKVLVHNDGLVEIEGLVRDRIVRAARTIHGRHVNQIRITGEDDAASVDAHDAEAQRSKKRVSRHVALKRFKLLCKTAIGQKYLQISARRFHGIHNAGEVQRKRGAVSKGDAAQIIPRALKLNQKVLSREGVSGNIARSHRKTAVRAVHRPDGTLLESGELRSGRSGDN